MLYEGTHFQSLYQGHPQICGNGLEYEKNTQTKTWPSDSLSSWVSSFFVLFLKKINVFPFLTSAADNGNVVSSKPRKKSA